MKMEELAKEFIFDCKVRELAPRTVRNYEKQLAYFVRFLKQNQKIENVEELKPIHIKQFIAMLQEKKNKPSYINDLLKVVKVLCRYAYEESLKNGLDLYSLSRLLGHESVSITQRYLEAVRDGQILTSARKTGVLANL